MTKENTIDINKTIIYYYFNNGHTTKYSLNSKKHSIWKCNIKSKIKIFKFYFNNNHSKEFLNLNKGKEENNIDIIKELYKEIKNIDNLLIIINYYINRISLNYIFKI